MVLQKLIDKKNLINLCLFLALLAPSIIYADGKRISLGERTTSIFSDSQLESFNKSNCPSECDDFQDNCGWGTVSEEFLKEKLMKCGFHYEPYLVTYEPQDINISCGSAINTKAGLESLEPLMEYSCDPMKSVSDGIFCECIVNKTQDSNNYFYSPLKEDDVADIKGLIRMDNYRRKIAGLQKSFYGVSKVLTSAAIDKDYKDLFGVDEKKKWNNNNCLAGSIQNMGKILFEAEKEGDQPACGKRGAYVFQSMSKESLLDCSKNENCLNKWNKINSGPDLTSDAALRAVGISSPSTGKFISASGSGFFGFINKQSLAGFEKEYGDLGEMKKFIKDDGFNLPEMQEYCQEHKGSLSNNLVRVCHSLIDQGDSRLPPNNHIPLIKKTIEDYRKNYSSSPGDTRAFALKMVTKGDFNDSLNQIMNTYSVLNQGVLDGNETRLKRLEKLVKLFDNVLPEDGSSELENFGIFDLKKKLDAEEKKIVTGAMDQCQEFFNETVKLCQSMDFSVDKKDDLTLDNFKDFDAEKGMRALEDKTLFDSLSGVDDGALIKKIDQFRCSMIIDKTKSGKLFHNANAVNAEEVDITEKKYVLRPAKKMNGFTPVIPAANGSTGFKLNEIIDITNSKLSLDNSRFLSKGAKEALSKFSKPEPKAPSRVASYTSETVEASGPKQLVGSHSVGRSVRRVNLSDTSAETQTRASRLSSAMKGREELNAKKDLTDDKLAIMNEKLNALIAEKDAKDRELAIKSRELNEKEKSEDQSYQNNLATKKTLEREIAELRNQKIDTMKEQTDIQRQLADINNNVKALPSATPTPGSSTVSAISSPAQSDGQQKIASTGTAGRRSSGGGISVAGVSAGSSASSSGNTESGENFNNSSSYVITLSQEEVDYVKDRFQILDSVESWVPGGKPPVILDGNIYFELEVDESGNIVYDDNGKPKRVGAVTGIAAGQKVGGSSRAPASVSKSKVEEASDSKAKERRARAQALNKLLKDAQGSR